MLRTGGPLPRQAGRVQNSARTVAAVLLALTVAQLVVGALVPGLDQFEGKGFGARLVAYPVMMLAVPVGWRLLARTPVPWAAVAWVMLPFLVDVTGNTLDLYDSVVWWDDANHLVNWFFLCLGAGLLLARGGVAPRWALGVLVAGVGALLAVAWELGEWATFIRFGTELATAYTDTLGDLVLGALGGSLAGLVVALRTPAAGRRP